MAWLGEKRKTEFSWTPATKAVSESRIFEQNKHFSRYHDWQNGMTIIFISLSSIMLSGLFDTQSEIPQLHILHLEGIT